MKKNFKKAQNELNIIFFKHNPKRTKIVCVLIFCFSILLLVINTLINNGVLYIPSPDGDLYLNIADNFLGSFHFIQNIRPHETDMIVPFGLPVIFIMLKLIVNSVYFIVFVQYIIFGITCVLLYLISKKIFSGVGVLSPIIFVFSIITFYPNSTPSYVTTETYFLFILVLSIYIFFSKIHKTKKLLLLNVVLFIGYIVRPLLSVIFFPCLFYTVLQMLFKKVDYKSNLKYIVIFPVILLLNVCVNYRETRNFVLLENYSGITIYLANNPNTKTTEYSSLKLSSFADERFYEIYNDSNITNNQKNKIFTEEGKNYMINNPAKTLENVFTKFYNLFLGSGIKWSVLLSIFTALLLIFFEKKQKKMHLITLCSFVLLCFATSMGLYMKRYSMIILPFLVIYQAGFFEILLKKIFNSVNIEDVK